MRKASLVLLVILLGSFVFPVAAQTDIPQPVQNALADLNKRLGTNLTFQTGQQLFWTWTQSNYPDTSLGCPLAGQTYTQQVTNGFSISLNYQGVEYNYRASFDGKILFLCTPGGSAPAATVPPGATLMPTPTLAPIGTPNITVGQVVCAGSLPTRLAVGMQGKAITTGSVNMRSQPNTTATVVGLLLPGGTFNVVGGPICGDRTWWQLNYLSNAGTTTIGWVGEGDSTEYWLEPIGGAPFMAPTTAALTLPMSSSPVTTANAAQMKLVGSMAITEMTAARSAIFSPSPTADIMLISSGNGPVYDHVITGELMVTFGTSGNTVLFAAGGPASASTITVATVEMNTSKPQVSYLVFWNAKYVPQPVTPTMVVGYELPVLASGFVSSGDGKRAALVGTIDNVFQIWIWDMVTGAQLTALPVNKPVSDVTLSPDGSLVAFTSPNDGIYVWAVNSATQVAYFPEPQAGSHSTASLAFSPDGTLLAAGTKDGRVRIWTVLTLIERNTIQVHPGKAVLYIAFNQDASVLATAGGDEAAGLISTGVYLWNAGNGTQLAALSGPAESITGLAFRGNLFAAAGRTSWYLWGVY